MRRWYGGHQPNYRANSATDSCVDSGACADSATDSAAYLGVHQCLGYAEWW